MGWLRPCLAMLSMLLAAALFGFFYAWVCSTMWGLDRAAPEVAIAAMQAMNASVRNAVFAPVFFGAGPMLLLTGALYAITGGPRPGRLFAAAGIICIGGAFLPTMLVSVPMNEALARVALPLPADEARAVWTQYSPRWQAWNIMRCLAAGAGVVLAGLGLAAAARLPVSDHTSPAGGRRVTQ